MHPAHTEIHANVTNVVHLVQLPEFTHFSGSQNSQHMSPTQLLSATSCAPRTALRSSAQASQSGHLDSGATPGLDFLWPSKSRFGAQSWSLGVLLDGGG